MILERERERDRQTDRQTDGGGVTGWIRKQLRFPSPRYEMIEQKIDSLTTHK